MTKENEHSKIIKEAFDSVELEENERKKEEERIKKEKEISKIKNVVKAHLQKIDFLDEQIRKLQEEKAVVKSDLEDLKAGRLDKIEERQKTDPTIKEKSIIIIERIVEKYIPDYPWRSPYDITWNTYSTSPNSICTSLAPSMLSLTIDDKCVTPYRSGYLNTSASNYTSSDLVNKMLNTARSIANDMEKEFGEMDSGIYGTTFQNFSSGSYKLNNGKIINL